MTSPHVAVECVGRGAPSLIFVCGHGGDRRSWNAQVEGLSQWFQVVAFDLPGHGESAAPEIASIETMARATSDVKDRYGEGHAVLIGHSMGCRVVVEACRLSPSGIDGLVLIDGSTLGHAAEAMQERISKLGMRTFLEAARAKMLGPDSDSALRGRLAARDEREEDPAFGAFGQELFLSSLRWDANEAPRALGEINVPVMLIQSTTVDENLERRSLEPGMTTPWTELVQEKVAGAELYVIPGMSHLVPMEAPAVVNEYIREFAVRAHSAALTPH